jgi:hypothetical protein
MRPAVNKSVDIPVPRIAFFHVIPPSLVTNIPPARILVLLALSNLSVTVIPVSSQTTFWFDELNTKLVFESKVFCNMVESIVPVGVTLSAARRKDPSAYCKLYVVAVIL